MGSIASRVGSADKLMLSGQRVSDLVGEGDGDHTVLQRRARSLVTGHHETAAQGAAPFHQKFDLSIGREPSLVGGPRSALHRDGPVAVQVTNGA